MKVTYILSLLAAVFIFSGCASTQSDSAATEENAVDSSAPVAREKTSYDGSTGSGLLMERYKAGQIEGYRD